jgi:hypothetical protein
VPITQARAGCPPGGGRLTSYHGSKPRIPTALPYLAARRAEVVDGPLAVAACSTAQERLRTVFDAELDGLGACGRAVLGRVGKEEPIHGR